MRQQAKMRFSVLILCAVFSKAICDNANGRECTRWNDYITTQTRSDAECMTWASTMAADPSCEDWGSPSDDVLRRRSSELLATPGFQGNCGSCWAFSSAHAYTDRLSINNSVAHELLSAMFPVTCFADEKYIANGNGCCGAKFINSGLVFFQDSGEVTHECSPYTLEDITEDTKDDISNKKECELECIDDDEKFQPLDLKLHGYAILQTEEEAMQALEYGPVVTAMVIPTDFPIYKCGIYESCTNQLLSGHAVELVDYGSHNGIDFWVVKNSWGPSWGEEGYFRIKRGLSYFGVGGYVAPILSPDQPVSNADAKAAACAEEEVEQPNNDMLIVCAAMEAVDEANNRSSESCPDGSPATIAYDSVKNASVQLVEGIWIELLILVDVLGCSEPLQAELNVTVFYSTNNTFNLTNSFGLAGYQPSGDGAGAVTSSVILIMTLVILLVALIR